MAKKETAIQLLEQRRNELLEAMPEPLQLQVKKISALMGLVSKGVLLGRYKIGKHIDEITSAEDKYGANAVVQCAKYLCMNEGTLYNCRNVTKKWTEAEVTELALRETADGGHISFEHLVILARINSDKDRVKFLEQVFEQGMSASDLSAAMETANVSRTRNANGAGRPPGRPSSPVAGAQQAFKVLQSLDKRFKVWEEAVFDAIDTSDANKVDSNLMSKLEELSAEAVTAEEVIGKIRTRSLKNLARVKKILNDEKTGGKPAAAVSKKKSA